MAAKKKAAAKSKSKKKLKRGLTASALIPYAELHLNGRVFAWGLLFALAFGVLSGAGPAWRLSRLHPVEALRGGTR